MSPEYDPHRFQYIAFSILVQTIGTGAETIEQCLNRTVYSAYIFGYTAGHA